MKINMFSQQMVLEDFGFIEEALEKVNIGIMDEFFLLNLSDTQLCYPAGADSLFFVLTDNDKVLEAEENDLSILENIETMGLKDSLAYVIQTNTELGKVYLYKNDLNLSQEIDEEYDMARKELMKLVESLE